MSLTPEVSVAVISYQQKAFIAEALQSVIDQDYPNVQIVVSDDHSTDGTADEIARIAERSPKPVLPLLNDQRAGITTNLNRALRNCTGKYVCFFGGDDLFLPGKITRQVEWMEEREERVLCGHQVEVFYDDGTSSHPYARPLTRGTGAADIIRRGPFAACSTMIRASAIPEHGFDEELSLVSDYLLAVEVLADGGEFGYVPGTYARYRRHDANVSANIAAMAADTGRALDLIAQRYPQYARDCRRARARFVDYSLGVLELGHGQSKAARQAFVDAIRRDPTFAKPWVRLIQSLLPS